MGSRPCWPRSPHRDKQGTVSLKFILVAVALPPMCFLYLAIAGVVLWRRRGGRILAGLGVLGLLVFSLPVVGASLILSLERDLPLSPTPGAMPQAIVILGGDIVRIPEPPFAVPGPLTLDRLRAGAALHRRTGLPILVTGGLVQPDRPAVGKIMAESLRDDFQVPVEWVEDKSADTWENAALSAPILRRKNIGSVYIVTNAWHMHRAVLAFRKAGMTVTAVPTLINTPFDPIVADFIPRVSTWGWTYFALHEWVGRAWYSLH